MLKVIIIFLSVLAMTYCVSKMFPDVKNKKEEMIDCIELFGFTLIVFLCCFYRHYTALKLFTSLFCTLIVWGIVDLKVIRKLAGNQKRLAHR